MLKIYTAFVFIMLAACFVCGQNSNSSMVRDEYESVYTILDKKHCRKLPLNPKEHEVDYKGMCPGVGGLKLKVANFDLHHVLDLVTPAGKTFNVGIDSASYNFLGTKAEWRVKQGKPFALIVRYNLIGPEANKVNESILVVSKVSTVKACVVGRIEGSQSQNVDARDLADRAQSMPCTSSN